MYIFCQMVWKIFLKHYHFEGMCLRKFESACTLGEAVLSFNSGRAQIENKWYLFPSLTNILLDMHLSLGSWNPPITYQCLVSCYDIGGFSHTSIDIWICSHWYIFIGGGGSFKSFRKLELLNSSSSDVTSSISFKKLWRLIFFQSNVIVLQKYLSE